MSMYLLGECIEGTQLDQGTVRFVATQRTLHSTTADLIIDVLDVMVLVTPNMTAQRNSQI